MKINYVPGLALRFFPGLSRELYDAVDTYIASNCKIAIFTGTAPTEQQVWDLANFNAYVTANTANLVYQETTQLQFSYDGHKHKRVIQRYPVDSTAISPLVAPITQDAAAITAGAIETPNSLYALVYCPDKDVTLNTTGNDLIIFVPNVGSGPTDFCSLSKTNFTAGESMYFRNLTISLFQGYQITDTLINGEYEDPLNPGQMITGPIDSKKSVYINKVWGNRLSEAYRDCFVSRDSFKIKYYRPTAKDIITLDYNYFVSGGGLLFRNFYSDYLSFIIESFEESRVNFYPRKFDTTNNTWLNTDLYDVMQDFTPYFGYIVNQSFINLVDTINSKGLLGQLSSLSTILSDTATVYTNNQKFVAHNHVGGVITTPSLNLYTKESDQVPGILLKTVLLSHTHVNIKNSIRQILIEQGIDSGMIDSALKSLIPIGFDNTKYSSAYDKDQNVLTIQNRTPAKLKTRYKKAIHNPTNEQLYIYIPRYLNRTAIEKDLKSNYQDRIFGSISSVSYPATQKVIDGEVVDYTTQRVRQNDYTAVSIGVTGNGETDLEYDNLDVIDYIDSFTAMIKIPNKF